MKHEIIKQTIDRFVDNYNMASTDNQRASTDYYVSNFLEGVEKFLENPEPYWKYYKEKTKPKQ